jgi:hypothetical protein
MGPSKQPSKRGSPDRRTVLKFFGASGVAAGTLVGTGEQAHAYDPGERETAARYRETDHVKAFYRTNGYETLKKG